MQSKPPVARLSLVNLSISGLLFAAAASSAHAAYTVIDDDLYPSSVAEARSAQYLQATPDHYTVSFLKYQAALGPTARAVLDSLAPQMLNASSIRIVGRPDAMPSGGNDKQGSVARNRAVNIRTYLVRQGIPESNIVVTVDNTPNPQAAGNNYPIDIYITRASSRSVPGYSLGYSAPEAVSQPMRAVLSDSGYRPSTASPSAAVSISVAPSRGNKSSDEQLTQYINQAVLSGQMLPAVALQLLRSMMESNLSQVPPQQTAQPVSSTVPVRAERWLLDKQLTLRDNIDAWARSAGWNPSSWEASNYFQITTTTTLDGGFPDVLRRVAESTGLNICAKTREKVVRVTDANVPCNK